MVNLLNGETEAEMKQARTAKGAESGGTEPGQGGGAGSLEKNAGRGGCLLNGLHCPSTHVCRDK